MSPHGPGTVLTPVVARTCRLLSSWTSLEVCRVSWSPTLAGRRAATFDPLPGGYRDWKRKDPGIDGLLPRIKAQVKRMWLGANQTREDRFRHMRTP